MGQNWVPVRLQRIWFAISKFSRQNPQNASGIFASHEVIFAKAKLTDSSLKDRKTTFSAFLRFQATFDSKSLSPQI
jgi:hypothetical protein